MNDSGSGKLREFARVALTAGKAAAHALAGNIHGVVVELVGILPQLLKAVAYILCFLTVMVMFMMSLPSMMLGYADSMNPEIQEMNAKAEAADAEIRKFGAYTQSLVDDLVLSITQSVPHDDLVVNTSVDALNTFWLTAIYSVAHKQDITTMGQADLIEKAGKSLAHSYTTETYWEEDGEGNPIECTRLIITITQMGAEAYMDALGFSDDEKTWAQLIYAATSETQLFEISSPDYMGSAGINYGDLVFTDGGMPVVYYNQADSRWADKPYGKSISIGRGGCGPTALAMAVSSLTGEEIDPLAMCQWAFDNGYCAEEYGSYHSLIPEGAEAFGLTVQGATAKQGQDIIDALASGDKLVIAIMSKGHFTKSGHFILLRGVTSDGKILVADPISTSRSAQEWDLRIILNEASRKAGSGGPFWVLGVE